MCIYIKLLNSFHVSSTNWPFNCSLMLKVLANKIHVPYTQGGQTNWNIRVWSRERFSYVGPCQDKGVGPGGHSPLPQTPQLPEEFQQSLFKGKDWRGASQGMWSACAQFSDCWCWGNRAVNIINSLAPDGLGAHDHQVVHFFHFMMVFSIWRTQETCLRYYHLGASERSYSRGYGGVVCPGKVGSCLVTKGIIHSL